MQQSTGNGISMSARLQYGANNRALPFADAFRLRLQVITHSGVIAGVLAIDMFALLMYNVAGMCVTGHLGAVFRQVATCLPACLHAIRFSKCGAHVLDQEIQRVQHPAVHRPNFVACVLLYIVLSKPCSACAAGRCLKPHVLCLYGWST